MSEENKEFVNIELDSEEIFEYVYSALTERGYAPKEEEVEDIADIIFDFFVDKGVVEEVFDGEVNDNEEEF